MARDGLFEPDVLISELSGVARRRVSALSSEKRLMLAVLQDAFECYQKYALADDHAGRVLFEEAAAWIESTRNDGLFSFENITETLDIEPQSFRRGLARWRERRLDALRVATPPRAVLMEGGASSPPARAGLRPATT